MAHHNPQSPFTEPPPGLLSRIGMAVSTFFKVLSDADFAQRLQSLNTPAAPQAPVPTPAPVAPVVIRPNTDAALQLLSLLQREARLIDFTQEDLSSYTDADIGGAARVVHEGCCKVLREHFTLAPLRPEAEGSRIRVEEGFDARAIRLTGNVVGAAPFTGTLSHRGWRATEVRLPSLTASHDATVLAQAEVEL